MATPKPALLGNGIWKQGLHLLMAQPFVQAEIVQVQAEYI